MSGRANTFDVWYPHDPSMHRPEGRLFRLPELFTEDELKTSPAYNAGWRVLDAQNSLNVRFDDPDGLRMVWFVGDPAGSDGWQSGQLKLIERLRPHVRQFVRVRQALAGLEDCRSSRVYRHRRGPGPDQGHAGLDPARKRLG